MSKVTGSKQRIGRVSQRDVQRVLKQKGYHVVRSNRHIHMTNGVVNVQLTHHHRGDLRHGMIMGILKATGISKDEFVRLLKG